MRRWRWRGWNHRNDLYDLRININNFGFHLYDLWQYIDDLRIDFHHVR